MDALPVLHEVEDDSGSFGKYTGQVKWFNKSAGYGFITVVDCADASKQEHKNKDIFVHYTAIKPLNCLYKTLVRGEYVNFNIEPVTPCADAYASDANANANANKIQASRVTGILGGALMCDMTPSPSSGFRQGFRQQRPKGYKTVTNKIYHRYHTSNNIQYGPRTQYIQDRLSRTHR